MKRRALPAARRTLVIACGALAHELVAVLRVNDWRHVDVECLPAHWHNTPQHIVPGVERKILAGRETHDRILVAYGDCGTGGQLDALLERYGVERLPGAHCYSFFAGASVFEAMADAEPGTFYLTDYLAANFERLIMVDLGIRKHPELRDLYFGNYTRVVYLVQEANPDAGIAGDRQADAEAAAAAIGLPLQIHHTGLSPITRTLVRIGIAAA